MKVVKVSDFVNGDARVVMLADAETEIDKARQDGYQSGLSVMMELNQGSLTTIRAVEEKACADERERIRARYDKLRRDYLPEYAARLAMGGPKPQESRLLEKITRTEDGHWFDNDWGEKVNAIIDAFNSLQEWLRK
jgi:hypothetical protein